MFRTDRPHSRMRQAILWGGLFLFTMILQFLARKVPGFAEGYAVTVYPVLFRLLGSISNIFSFAVDELFIYLIILFFCAYVFTGIRRMRKKQMRFSKWGKKTLAVIGRLAILWFCVFTLNCGINYHRTLFSELAGLPAGEPEAEELEKLCMWLTEQIAEVSGQIEKDEKGFCSLPEQIQEKTRDAMIRLGEQYPELSGWYPKAKPVFTWKILSMGFLEGVSGPYTMEANYNPDIPAYNQPAVLCHELSHLKGFMREDEANYIAYMACTGSEDANLRYSGLMLAYTHSINALYKADSERFVSVREQLCRQAELDYAYHRRYWERYEGLVSELSDQANHVYLKANAQAEGSKSYGRMVDLLIGEYRQKKGEEL